MARALATILHGFGALLIVLVLTGGLVAPARPEAVPIGQFGQWSVSRFSDGDSGSVLCLAVHEQPGSVIGVSWRLARDRDGRLVSPDAPSVNVRFPKAVFGQKRQVPVEFRFGTGRVYTGDAIAFPKGAVFAGVDDDAFWRDFANAARLSVRFPGMAPEQSYSLSGSAAAKRSIDGCLEQVLANAAPNQEPDGAGALATPIAENRSRISESLDELEAALR